MTVAFDCDGTLIDVIEDQPRPEIVEIAKALMRAKHDVTIWSGGGERYAQLVARRCGLDGMEATARAKPVGANIQGIVDVAFDDQAVVYGKINIRV